MSKIQKLCRRLLSIVVCGLLLCGCDEKIIHDLSEYRANHVTVVLSSFGIAAKKSNDGTSWSVSVPKAQTTAALTALSKSRILSRDVSRFTEQSSSFISSQEERKSIIERQLAWNLEQTLERLPGVLEARVHVFSVSQNAYEIRNRRNDSSASVLLITTDAKVLPAAHVKQLIAGASGVAEDAISVIVTVEPHAEQLLPLQQGVQPSTIERMILAVSSPMALLQLAGATALFVMVWLLLGRRSAAKTSANDDITTSPSSSSEQETSWTINEVGELEEQRL